MFGLKPVSVLIAATALLTLTACGGGGSESTDGESTAPTAAPTAPVFDTEWEMSDAKLDKAVVNKYGREDALAVAADIASLIKHYAANEDLVNGTAADNRGELDKIAATMTADAAADWSAALDAQEADRADANKAGTVYVIALSDFYPTVESFDGAPATKPTSGPSVVNPVVSDRRVALEPDGRLKVSSTTEADMRVTSAGLAKIWHFKRVHDFYMVKTKGEWKIDGWNANFQADPNLRADTTTN